MTVTVPGVIVVEPVDPTEPETPGGTGSLGDIFSKLPTGSLGAESPKRQGSVDVSARMRVCDRILE